MLGIVTSLEVIAAIGGTVAALMGGLGALIAGLSRRELRHPDANGFTLRQEVMAIRLALDEHIAQSEQAMIEARERD